MRIGTPVNQVRLTNVAYVRLNKNGKRFEIAAYRNKVLSYRNKVETDLSQVLQIDTVFTNVTKGLLANSKDLIEAFGTSDQILVCKEILDKGELQVSEQERVALLDSTFRDVASIVADKAINPENNRPYTVSMIQNAMRQIHYSVNVSKSSKSQALDVIRKLKAIMPIARASMLLRVVCPSKYLESMKDILLKEFNVFIITQGIQGQSNTTATATATDDIDNTNVKENDSSPNNVFMEFKFDTELFRKLEETVQQHTRNEGILEVLQLRTSSGPSDSSTTSNTTNNTTTPDDNPIDTELPQPQIEKKAKDVISKSELKKIEKNNDFKVNANSDDDDDDDDEEETVFGIVKKNKKIKKNKNKNDIDKNDTVEKHNHRDNEDDDGDDDDDKGDGKGAQKKSKKAKRLEKEEKKEREVKESKMKQRIENEKAKREAAISTTTTTTTTTTTDASAPTTEVDKQAATTATTGTTIAAATTTTSSKCNTCGGSFPDAASYRAHFKSEWHRYNLNRKMKSLPIVPTEEAFAKLSFDEINAASISSGQTGI